MRDSIKLNDSERRALLERLALHDAVSLERSSREHKRLKVPSNITIEVILTHPGGGEVHVRAVVKDVSKTGLGMLYGGFLHHGTRVAVRFIGDDRNALIVQGAKVVRCVHVQGPVHEIGMRFDAEVPVDSLFGLVDDRAGDDDSPQAAAYAQLDSMCNDIVRLVRSRNSFAEIAELAKRLGEAAEKESAVGKENPAENEKPADTPG
ncbi:MAG: PilZ domain-containing protein [Phycisphaerales bacterium]|nr:PilZ domain-containing protein [Phycisphaerales bacterium]